MIVAVYVDISNCLGDFHCWFEMDLVHGWKLFLAVPLNVRHCSAPIGWRLGSMMQGDALCIIEVVSARRDVLLFIPGLGTGIRWVGWGACCCIACVCLAVDYPAFICYLIKGFKCIIISTRGSTVSHSIRCICFVGVCCWQRLLSHEASVWTCCASRAFLLRKSRCIHKT